MARFYLGIDGGQSSTTALIADEAGRIIGSGSGGPCNHVSTAEGRTRFFAAVGACVTQACTQAGLDPSSLKFRAVCLGFSGGPEDKDVYARQLIRSELYKITHDAEIALIGATAGEPGIVVIAGTGSMAFGRNRAGQPARAGGWGYIFGDEGGAFDLSRKALRAALRYEEGWGPPTLLRTLLLEATGAATANELLHRLYGAFDRTYIATFAPIVDKAAAEGDQVAGQILQSAAEALAELAEGAYKQFANENEVLKLTYVGGIFESPTLCKEFKQCIKSHIGYLPVPAQLSPAAGALLEAFRLDGLEVQLSGLKA